MYVTFYFEGPPTGVMAEAVGTDRVHVTWELPPASNCRKDFRIFVTPEKGGGTLPAVVGSPSVSDYTFLGLHCNTAYVFTVGSVTHDGNTASVSEGVRALAGGNYSYYCLCIPLLMSCPPGPRSISAAGVSSTSVHLTWEPPASPCDESITGYQVTYTYSKCGMSANGSLPALTGVEYTFDRLEEDTEYQFRLRAAGKDFTDPVSVRTLTDG